MLAVNFYKFNKKENSTARPSSTPNTFDCTILRGSGVINPTIELDIGLTTNPSNWNYCYIPNFGRYYYITEWYYNEVIWTATLKVDVLATYKPDIGRTSLYVLRASAEYDGRVIDNLYPCKTECSYDTTSLTSPWTNALNGMYVLGLVSTRGLFGSLTYVAMDRTQLQNFLSYLADNTVTENNDFDLTEMGKGLQLAIANPMQYIASVVFIPCSSVGGVLMPGIPVFKYSVLSSCYIIHDPALTFSYTMEVKKHPQTNTRGNYVNSAPYTKCTLMFPPFGVIDIDSSVICDVDSINLVVRLDIPTGLGILEIFANGILINKLEAQIGVPVELAQFSRDYVGSPLQSSLGAMFSMTGGGNMLTAGALGGALKGFTGKVSGIGNALETLGVRANTVGSGGSYSQLLENARLDFQFFEIVDDDISQNGRPLCKKRTPASLGGYMLIQDGDVPNSGTLDESIAIKNYLETGFYYE